MLQKVDLNRENAYWVARTLLKHDGWEGHEIEYSMQYEDHFKYKRYLYPPLPPEYSPLEDECLKSFYIYFVLNLRSAIRSEYQINDFSLEKEEKEEKRLSPLRLKKKDIDKLGLLKEEYEKMRDEIERELAKEAEGNDGLTRT